jgi:general secretion pathway protein G
MFKSIKSKTKFNITILPIKINGFTLIELLVVMAVIGILAAIITPNYIDYVENSREISLKYNLKGLREALDLHYRDKGFYPKKLEDLVTEKYLRAIPIDPITQTKESWVLIKNPTIDKEIFDIKSGAEGNSKNGVPYKDW